MIVPILIALGAAVAVAAGSGKSTPATLTVKRLKLPKSNFQLITDNADQFWRTINKSAIENASKGSLGDAAKTARAAQAKAESDSKKNIDTWADDAAKAAAKTGVGLPLVPFIYLGAKFAKWSQDLAKKVFYTDGWSQKWVDLVEKRSAEFIAAGIPFRRFVKPWDTSPMGYDVAGGGDTCSPGTSSSGLCNLTNEFFDARILSPKMRQAASLGFARMRDGAKDGSNPFSIASYLLVQAIQSADWCRGAPTSSEIASDAYRKEQAKWIPAAKPSSWPADGYPYERILDDEVRYWNALVAAVAIAHAKAYGVPFERWRDVVLAAWWAWDVGVKDVRARTAAAKKYTDTWFNPGEGALGFAMASQGAMNKCDEIRKSRGKSTLSETAKYAA